MSDDIDDLLRELQPDDDDHHDDSEELGHAADAFIGDVVAAAVAQKASAIHFVPADDRTHVRFRVAGTMHDWTTLPRRKYQFVALRLKVRAKLDIAERRAFQNGRVELGISGAVFMVCTLPTARNAEALVLRRLEAPDAARPLRECGYDKDLLETLERASAARSGLIVVAGRAASGRSTSRYALLERAIADGRSVMTYEDPVRRPLDGAIQVNADPHVRRVDHALAMLRRSDPDVVMVGGVYDSATAQWCVTQATGGRLVVTTLPVWRASDVAIRLTDMGVEPFLVADALRAVVAQQLVRRLCPDCRVPVPAPPGMAAKLPDTIRTRHGCPKCFETGWRGRLLVAEGFAVDAAARSAIVRGQPVAPPRTMRDHALGLVVAGETSLGEALSVEE